MDVDAWSMKYMERPGRSKHIYCHHSSTLFRGPSELTVLRVITVLIVLTALILLTVLPVLRVLPVLIKSANSANSSTVVLRALILLTVLTDAQNTCIFITPRRSFDDPVH